MYCPVCFTHSKKMKTDKHDKIHLWFHNRQNVDLFVRFMHDHIRSYIFAATEYRKDAAFEENGMIFEGRTYNENKHYRDVLQEIEVFEFSEKDIEVPIFSSKAKLGAHTNTIDNIITVSVRGPGTTFLMGIKSDEVISKRLHERDLQFELKILSEYKPTLDKVSNFLGQIKIYQIKLEQQKEHPHVIITPVLVTLDQDGIYDNMIQERGITIFRLEWDYDTNRVATPKHMLMKYAQPPTQPELDKANTQQNLTD
jgi:hypothetical protein